METVKYSIKRKCLLEHSDSCLLNLLSLFVAACKDFSIIGYKLHPSHEIPT